MRFLTKWRRRRSAGLIVLLGVLIACGSAYAVASPPEKAEASKAQSTQIEEGRKLFAVSCSSCHGMNAEGTNEGPSLIGVGAASVDFQVGTGRMPAQQPGPQAPKKKAAFNEEETEALAAYVASLGPGPAVPGKEKTDDLADADIAEGGELFRTNCSACHNVTGKGGALTWGKHAPDLEGVSGKHVYEAMLTGPQQMPVFSEQVLTPEEKKNIIAFLKEEEEGPSPGGLSLGGLGPVSEGLFVWVIGIGLLVVAAVWITARGAKAKGTKSK